VIYPPFDDHFYKVGNGAREYYLVVSAFVPYKKIDIVIRAFNELDRPLFIVGSGPLDSAYRKLRTSERISFLGQVGGEELRKLYSGARALIFPTEEDFGIVPVEAQACGTPVLAYAKGGALETVMSGVFFYEQTAGAVRDAVLEFENKQFDRSKISQQLDRFAKPRFKADFRESVDHLMGLGAADVSR
jgi:glycosyltransferase involved in cell wall biosynthesis